MGNLRYFWVLFLLFPVLVLAEDNTVTGKVSSAIVYRGQAMVTRDIELNPAYGAGGFEIVVTNLPDQIVPESIYAVTPDGVTVSSVRYRVQTIKEDTRQEVAKIKDDIEKLEFDKYKADKNREMALVNWNSLDKLENYAVNAKDEDLSKGLLQAQPVIEITTYIESQRAKFRQISLDLDEQIKKLDKEIHNLKKQLKELEENRQTHIRQAVLLVNKAIDAPAVIKLNYLVNNANWTPQYNLYADTGNGKCTIQYNAVLHQATGEDWQAINLSLSTAEPSIVAGAPTLDPLEISLGQPIAPKVMEEKIKYDRPQPRQNLPQGMPGGMGGQLEFEYQNQTDNYRKMLESRREEAAKGKRASVALNSLAIQNQAAEILADADTFKRIKSEIQQARRREGIAVTYQIQGNITLPSKSDQQLVNIDNANMNAEYTMLAMPLLTDFVYLQGSLKNTSNTIFLPGNADIYSGGQFVGKGEMPMVTINETFDTGFGIDSQIKVVREFEDKKVDTLWGNRIDENSYRIAIHNYKNKPVKLRLYDRIPFTNNTELSISELKTNIDISKDAEYRRTDYKKGILRWDLELKPNTSDDKATVISYQYTLKYDSDLQIKPLPKKN